MEELLSYIENHGLALVALLFLVYWIRPKLDQLWSRAFSKPEDDSFGIEHLKQVFETDGQLNDVLSEMLSTFHACYTTLWQLHNGQQSLSGFPFVKVSATHQKSCPGRENWGGQYQGLPVSLLFVAPVDKIVQRICCDDEQNSGYESIMREKGTKVAYICSVCNSRGLQVAYVAVSFTDFVELDVDQMDRLTKFISRISILLEMRKRAEVSNGKETQDLHKAKEPW